MLWQVCVNQAQLCSEDELDELPPVVMEKPPPRRKSKKKKKKKKKGDGTPVGPVPGS